MTMMVFPSIVVPELPALVEYDFPDFDIEKIHYFSNAYRQYLKALADAFNNHDLVTVLFIFHSQ